MERKLFIIQRLSTLLLIPFVLVHVGVMIYATHSGLSAGAILGRTQGSVGWLLFYSTFVLCVAVHAPLGVRAVLSEWTGIGYRAADGISLGLALLLLILGIRAVIAVGGL
ncbi:MULTISPECIES: succinate dehydrogenase membrane anchor [Brenneria]|uniref:Succinate dehydrogenase n=1 Tax=Brenneria nigrifluens DSM 30175 = ATCC 13028 TaxID=1121120 RepID=A0A2U1US89_9GAMM|nr:MULTISPECIES: succinate dehydrogenase membrane anchor [Brenneria]EHD21110.1 putative membrane protein 13 [Brenneria sp. EniD312]PWC24530.1 succinate dehydrogenase [Brenneria nigrifluens] [Brenneria nigrifluens DSM 30175 = ATCC 13028]QCR04261.1 succinate dehydrogenase [Brenneria nigrifluens] [Brenneria nigrifluens DSM 30175 = ATCC 13028]